MFEFSRIRPVLFTPVVVRFHSFVCLGLVRVGFLLVLWVLCSVQCHYQFEINHYLIFVTRVAS